jgi:hypothetical protein
MIRKALVVIAALAIAGTAQAAGVNGASVSKDKRTTTAQHGSTTLAPAVVPGGGKMDVIFSNLGFKYPKGYYFCCYGDTISGPNSQIGSTIWVATQFTPAADASVKEIDLGVGWVSGTNKVIINIAEDDGGVPGNVLGSWPATGLGTFGDCCQLATATGIKHVKLTAGTPYWIYVSTDDSDSDTWAAWPFNSTDETDPMPVAGYDGTSWTNFGSFPPAMSFAVLGNNTKN